MSTVEYVAGADLPDLAITWTDTNGDVINFGSGWTFTAHVGIAGLEPVITKTTGITGASTAPNVVVAWDAGELDALDARVWTCQVTAHNTATGKERIRTLLLQILESIA